jgi:DNA-binding CsgD family transcriptional regulator
MHDRKPLKIGQFCMEPERQLQNGDLGLSLRELEVLQLLAQGNTSKHIARSLNLSSHTVDTYLRRIYVKLGVHTSTAAVAIAIAFQSGLALSRLPARAELSEQAA